MMSEEEKKAIEYLVIIKNRVDFNKIGYVYFKEYLEIVLNVINKFQKENKEKDDKLKNLIKRLDNDVIKITGKMVEKRTFPNYLDDYTRCRLKAYRTKTKEIKKCLEEILS